MQIDTSRSSSRKEVSTKREPYRPAKPPGKSATILLDTEHPLSEVKPNAPASQEKGKKYCPYCDHGKHSLNNCTNLKQLTTAQKHSWIKYNNRCWRCGRAHRAAECDLKMTCKSCNNRHLLVLHDINSQAQEKVDKSQDWPEDLPLRTVRQDLQVLHGAAVSFMLSPASEPCRVYEIKGAFTAKELGHASCQHPAEEIQPPGAAPAEDRMSSSSSAYRF